MDTINSRLRILERQFHRARTVNRILLVAVATLCWIAAAQQSRTQTSGPAALRKSSPPDAKSDGPGWPRTISAGQLVLHDVRGRMRTKIEVTDGGPLMTMFDQDGQKRLELGESDGSWGLRMCHADQSPVVSLSLPPRVTDACLEIKSPQGRSLTKAQGLSIRDAADQGRLLLALLNENFATLGIGSGRPNGPPSIELTASGGSGNMKLHNADGDLMLSMFATDTDTAFIELRHPEQDRSLRLSTGSANVDGPTISMIAPATDTGEGGHLPFLHFGLHADRQPFLHATDPNGTTRSAFPSN